MTARNVSASVKQRLLNLAKAGDVPFQQVLQRYAVERFLFRLSLSPHAGSFVLKGAQMLIAWKVDRLRPTLDIDLLGYTENSLTNLETIGRDICTVRIPEEDGLHFDANSIRAIRIKEDADYEGVRLAFVATLANARIRMQIDVGFHDTVTPAPEHVTYPSLLGMDEPRLRGYNRETLLAEKIEAMIKLGGINSRMKDFFDIWLLSQSFLFSLSSLTSAVEATCRARDTKVTGLPITLKTGFEEEAQKHLQWAAFIRKSGVVSAPATFSEVANAVRTFVELPIQGLTSPATATPDARWTPPGPWR